MKLMSNRMMKNLAGSRCHLCVGAAGIQVGSDQSFEMRLTKLQGARAHVLVHTEVLWEVTF